MNCGWKGTIKQFLQLSLDDFLHSLTTFVYGDLSSLQNESIQPQRRAWIDCYEKLQHIFAQYRDVEGWLIFEYTILRGSGRRPDVILLIPGHAIVIECKSYNDINSSECFQTSLYVRDLEHYHSAIQQHNIKVTGVLLCTNDHTEVPDAKSEFRIYVASKNSLSTIINGCLKKATSSILTADQFLEGTYQPSPSMLEAARSMMQNEPLPRIKAIDSSNFEQVYETVLAVIEQAQQTNTHHLILVSGEPGAGKTFLGLEIAHNVPNAVYLSGNGPLVDVLQDTLKNDTFVQSLYSYKTAYLREEKVPHEQIIIFDEAQRAWDAEKMKGKFSEPDIMIQIAKTNKPWSVTIGLIGEGQEIYLGEEGGLRLWNDAIKDEGIIVHAKYENTLFTNAERYERNDHLHLNCSLRSHAALQYYEFVNALLAGNIKRAQTYLEPLESQRYPVLVTTSLEKAKAYMTNLYENDAKTYGVICASGNDRSKQMRVIDQGKRYVKPKPHTAYFNYPDNEYYCKNLQFAATEFQTQGLELDCAIVHWDEDLCWDGQQWQFNHLKRGAKNPAQMKLNAYRVLLTRGRDATIIYIPRHPHLAQTWRLLTHTLRLPVL